MTTAGTSLLLRSATKYLGVSKYHAMAEVGPSHAESSSQRSAASFASFSQPLSQHSSQDERPPSSARAGAASARACKAGPSDAASLAAGGGGGGGGGPGTLHAVLRRVADQDGELRRLGDKVALLDATVRQLADARQRDADALGELRRAQAQAQQALPALVETLLARQTAALQAAHHAQEARLGELAHVQHRILLRIEAAADAAAVPSPTTPAPAAPTPAQAPAPTTPYTVATGGVAEKRKRSAVQAAAAALDLFDDSDGGGDDDRGGGEDDHGGGGEHGAIDSPAAPPLAVACARRTTAALYSSGSFLAGALRRRKQNLYL